MKKFLLFIPLLLAAFHTYAQATEDSSAVSYVSPTEYVIAAINVKGDEYLDKRSIIMLSGLNAGKKIAIPGEEITLAIQNLWKQQLFSDVNILLDSTSGNLAYLTIDVKTQPRLSKYNFSGISKAQGKKLKDEINITSGKDIVTEQLLARVTDRIQSFYIKKGFPNAQVNIDVKPDTLFKRNSVSLKINVDRGKRIRIQDVSFDGNTAFTDKRLRRVLKKTKEYHLFDVFRPSKYQPEEYQADLDKLVAFYQSHGYKDARITSDSLSKPSIYRLNVKINLFEGNKYYFRNISWAGNTKYDSRFLSSVLGIKKGDIYNPELMEKNLFASPNGLDVTSLYMDDGYLFFNVTPVETQVENDSVDIELRIFEGPQAIINNVTVTGNTKTHDHVILRELRTKPGQKFSRSDVIRSQRELAQLGYFDPEKMNVVPKPNPEDGTVDIEYQVVEKPSDQIELSGGWGAGNLVGVLGLSLNNFSIKNIPHRKAWQGYPSGDGQRLSVRAQTNGPAIQSYNLSFTDPWFGGKKPNSFTLSGFYSIQRYGNLTDKVNRTELLTPGVSVALGKRLKWPDDYFTWTNSLTYQYYQFHNYTIINDFPSGFSNSFYLQSILARNSLSHPIYPRSGSMISLQLQATPPLSTLANANKDYSKLTPEEKYKWLEYYKWKFDAAHYMGLGAAKKFVLMSAASFGFIGRYNNQLGYTPFERFYVGGDGLAGYRLDGRELVRLRGYPNYDAVTPKTTSKNGTVLEEGATIYDKFTFELRYPISTNEAATVYALAFVEGGNAWQRFKYFNPFELKRSAGVGLRVYLPMFGLLGFDVGYGFDQYANDMTKENKPQFHFYIGQSLF